MTVPFQLVVNALTSKPARVIDIGPARRAAVAAIFREGSCGAELLFIQRAIRAGDPWSGQIAFPGGSEEPEDSSLRHTAARETREEVGLDLLGSAEFLGELDQLRARSRVAIKPLTIHPYAWTITGDPPFPVVPNDEVADAFWVPVRDLLDPARAVDYDAQRTEIPYTFPGVDLGAGRVLWGLTHRMVFEMKARLGLLDEAELDARTMPRPR